MITVDEIKSAVVEEFSSAQVYFSLSEIQHEIDIPEAWSDFGIEINAKFPKQWSVFANKMPWVCKLLEKCLLGTAVVYSDEASLVYIFHDDDSLCYYLGGRPVSTDDDQHYKILGFPPALLDFYTVLHDGFTFFPNGSMGPQRIRDFSRVIDLVDEQVAFSPLLTTIFSNGGGDYVALDISQADEDKAYIWFHEDPLALEADVNIFSVMDAWISLFLEDVRLRDELHAANVSPKWR